MKFRRQYDGKGDDIAKRSRLDCSTPVVVRPEFGPDTDVKTILRRHGALVSNKTPIYTENDFDQDLTTALDHIKKAQMAFLKLPKDQRDRFQSPEQLWAAYQNGDLDKDQPVTPPPIGDDLPLGTLSATDPRRRDETPA